MIHQLKTTPEYFEAVASGHKTFEVRKNDRGFKVGDFLGLNEFNANETGRFMIVEVIYVLDNEDYCKDGQVILGIRPCGIKQLCRYDFPRDSLDFRVPIYDNSQNAHHD